MCKCFTIVLQFCKHKYFGNEMDKDLSIGSWKSNWLHIFHHIFFALLILALPNVSESAYVSILGKSWKSSLVFTAKGWCHVSKKFVINYLNIFLRNMTSSICHLYYRVPMSAFLEKGWTLHHLLLYVDVILLRKML